jgi:hypothetical protein
MTGRHALHADDPVALRAPRGRLTLVATSGADVYRTFADAAEARRSGPPWRRRQRLVPAGRVHAAELQGDRSLCGLPLESVLEFGRSRWPFERFGEDLRCPACHAATG